MNQPLDSPQRILKQGLPQTPNDMKVNFMTNDMTLSESIQANTFLSHLSKKNSQINLESERISTPPNKRKNSMKIERKESDNQFKEEGQSATSIAESPKFL